MESPAFVIVALIVAILILANAIASLVTPISRYCQTKYLHYKILKERRERFYRELGVLTN